MYLSLLHSHPTIAALLPSPRPLPPLLLSHSIVLHLSISFGSPLYSFFFIFSLVSSIRLVPFLDYILSGSSEGMPSGPSVHSRSLPVYSDRERGEALAYCFREFNEIFPADANSCSTFVGTR